MPFSLALTMAPDDQPRKGIPLPWGSYAKIARRLRPKVTPQHVRLVARGERESARVMRAILRFAEKMDTAA